MERIHIVERSQESESMGISIIVYLHTYSAHSLQKGQYVIYPEDFQMKFERRSLFLKTT